jgi:L-ascorbate metabolism protein UlaG (beta-lactamase superfamily)
MASSALRIRSLGWAGVELAVGHETLLIDPLADPGAVFAALGDAGRGIEPPEVVAPDRPGVARGALLTHLHRDHADATAVSAGIAAGAPVLEPRRGGGEGLEELALALAEHELAGACLDRRHLVEWERVALDPFAVTALPAVDGTGDPQLSWLVEAGGLRVVHLGDTMFHGHWWRIALRAGPIDVALVPINGAVLDFPHRQPPSALPGVMDPEQAAEAVGLLGARIAVPIHHGGYAGSGLYRPAERALERFLAAADRAGTGWRAQPLGPGEAFAASGADGAGVSR